MKECTIGSSVQGRRHRFAGAPICLLVRLISAVHICACLTAAARLAGNIATLHLFILVASTKLHDPTQHDRTQFYRNIVQFKSIC